jgi:hypothetical protein
MFRWLNDLDSFVFAPRSTRTRSARWRPAPSSTPPQAADIRPTQNMPFARVHAGWGLCFEWNAPYL